MSIYQLLKPILFKLDAESVHHAVFNLIKVGLKSTWIRKQTAKYYQVKYKHLKRNLFGLEFENPIGLAAGFDKNASLYNELSCFGFGFIEVGTITPVAQEGNSKNRLFRLPKDRALINRMGFNNDGVEVMVQNLRNRKTKVIIGGNIGKNKVTPNEDAISDYLKCFEALDDYVDYFVINVSSPNTPNLRALQEKEPLTQLINAVLDARDRSSNQKPVLLKIAPDLSNSALNDIVSILKASRLDGVIATNTTIDRSQLKTDPKTIENIGAGGLSGQPLKERSTAVVRYLREKLGPNFPIVAVGGVATAKDAIEKIEAGADLVQLYTSFIYEGPTVVKNINQGLIDYYESKD